MKHTIHSIALLATLTACVTTDANDRRVMNKEVIRSLYEDTINTGRLEALSRIVSDDYTDGNGGRGVAAFRENVAELRKGFPDIHFTIEDLIAEGDRVVIRWKWEATHDGPFRGIAPTHKRLNNTGIAIYQIRDGKVVRNWLESDRLGALQQLGVVPARPAANPSR